MTDNFTESLFEKNKIFKEFFIVKALKMGVQNESKERVQVEKTVAYCNFDYWFFKITDRLITDYVNLNKRVKAYLGHN